MSAWGVFVAGTDTGVGKTRVSAGLLRALQLTGVRAAGVKAVASGTDASGVNEDVAALRAASGELPGVASQDLNPYCFPWPISPHLAAARAGTPIHTAHIRSACERIAAACDALLMEGTGGWLAPISEQQTMADVARALGLPVVLVVGVRLGCLNHALLTARAIAADNLALLGWIGSVLDPGMLALQDNLDTLERRLPAPRLGLLPYAASTHTDGAQLAAAAQALCVHAAAHGPLLGQPPGAAPSAARRSRPGQPPRRQR